MNPSLIVHAINTDGSFVQKGLTHYYIITSMVYKFFLYYRFSYIQGKIAANAEIIRVGIDNKLSDKENIIVAVLKNNPTISIQKLADTQKLSVREVRTIISKLNKIGVVEHIGLKKGGYGKVNIIEE